MTEWEMPWTAEEMEDYRRGAPGKRYKRTWAGPSPDDLWSLYGGRGAPGLIECPDCGRPHGKGMDDYNGLCWNCFTENTRPGWQAEAIRRLYPQKVADAAGAKGMAGLKKLKGDLT